MQWTLTVILRKTVWEIGLQCVKFENMLFNHEVSWTAVIRSKLDFSRVTFQGIIICLIYTLMEDFSSYEISELLTTIISCSAVFFHFLFFSFFFFLLLRCVF